MDGQTFDEISDLASQIRMKKQTLQSAKEMLDLLDEKIKPQFGLKYSLNNIELQSSSGQCRIHKDEMPMKWVEMLLEETIVKAKKDLIPLEERFASITITIKI